MLWGWPDVFCLISAEGENFYNILIILNLSQHLVESTNQWWSVNIVLLDISLSHSRNILDVGKWTVYNHWWSVGLSWQNKPLDDLTMMRNFLWNSQTPKVLFPPVFNQLHMVHMSKLRIAMDHSKLITIQNHTNWYARIEFIHHFSKKINLNEHVYQPKPHGNHNFPSDMVLSFPRWTRGWRNQSRNSGVASQGYKGSCQHSLDHHPWWWWQEAPAVALTHDS